MHALLLPSEKLKYTAKGNSLGLTQAWERKAEVFGGPELLYRHYQCCCISKERENTPLFSPAAPSTDMAVQAFPWLYGSRLGKAMLAEKLFSLTYAQLPEEAFPLQPYQQRV